MENNAKIVFVSTYDNSDKEINGFVQLFNSFSAYGFQTKLLPLQRIWDFTRIDGATKIIVNVPFRFLSLLDFLPFLVKIPKMPKADVLIFDSNPYLLILSKIIIKKLKPSKIVYRQSDPIGIIQENSKILKEAEQDLMEMSDQVWVPNQLIKTFYEKEGYKNLNVLKNPVKEISAQLTTLSDSDKLSYREIVNQSKHYDKTCIYFGKFQIDYQLLNKMSDSFPHILFLIAGDYEATSKVNLKFLGFQNLNLINALCQKSDLFFLPYKKIGPINDFLHITSKVLLASQYRLRVLAHGVSEDLSNYGINVANDHASFLKKLDHFDDLKIPQIDANEFSCDFFATSAMDLIKIL